jgi:hypothetical protein
MRRAGVRPRFPAIYGDLMAAAVEHTYLNYEEWRGITRNRSEAQRLFGNVLNQAWGFVQGEFLDYLIGRVASTTLGAVVTIIPLADELIDEAQWNRSEEFRQNNIYLWLLRQQAMSMSSAHRGYRVTEWDSGVQSIHDMLITQTLNFIRWIDSDEVREFRRREMEASGRRPGVRYFEAERR